MHFASREVWRVEQNGLGLRVGDVLRAFSTLVMRYDSDRREVQPRASLLLRVCLWFQSLQRTLRTLVNDTCRTRLRASRCTGLTNIEADLSAGPHA